MSVISQLYASSWKGVPFFSRSSSETGGFKTAKHVYPGSDNVIVEQLGKVPRDFTIPAEVRFQDGDAFDTALNTPGSGILVHQDYGNITAKLTEYTKEHAIESIGLYRYSLNFTVEVGVINPTATTVSTSDVNQVRIDTFDNTSVYMEKGLEDAQEALTFGLNRNIVLTGMSDQTNILLDDVVGSVRRVVNLENSELNEEVENIRENLIPIISDNELNTAFSSMFNVLDLVGSTARDRYLISRELFGFGLDKTEISTNEALKGSIDIIDTGARLYNMALAYDNAVGIEFSNQEDLDEIIEQLNTEFQSLLNSGLLDSDTRLALSNLRTTSMKFFATLQLRSIFDFTTTLVPSTVLSHRLYGTSSLSDTIVSLNKAYNTAFIQGDIKVLTTE